MAYFNIKKIEYEPQPQPIPPIPPYVPPTPPEPVVPDPGSVPIIPRDAHAGGAVLTLYNVFDDNNVLNKELLNPLSFNIAFKEGTNVLNPTILIEDFDNDISSFNYAYIDLTDRYYFVNSIELLPGNIFQLNLSVDVLMSYKDEIKNLNGIIRKTEVESLVNNNLNDGSFVNEAGCFIELKVFSNGFADKPTNILVTAGGNRLE